MKDVIPFIFLLIGTGISAWILITLADRKKAALDAYAELHTSLTKRENQLFWSIPPDLWQCAALWRMGNGDLRLICGSLRSNQPEGSGLMPKKQREALARFRRTAGQHGQHQ